jgi:hypothetical protein
MARPAAAAASRTEAPMDTSTRRPSIAIDTLRPAAVTGRSRLTER